VEYPLRQIVRFAKEVKPEDEEKVVVEGRAERAEDENAYKIKFSALGRSPAYIGKTSLTIHPKERRMLTLEDQRAFVWDDRETSYFSPRDFQNQTIVQKSIEEFAGLIRMPG
jgi:hypothetical protein